jgi:predicted nuclease of predicted toxin-antitoxin system
LITLFSRWPSEIACRCAVAACPLRLASGGGHEAQHVEDVGLRAADDGAIWAYALADGSVILTKDEDFATRSTQTTNPPVIIWLRVGNTTNRVLRQWIEPRLTGIEQLVSQGHRLVEVI